ncbi:hypothetical protein D3C85_15510 [compost metagenome]
MYYFSPVDLAFNYGASIWEVAIEITDEAHALLMNDLGNGYTLEVDENGFPYSVPPEVPLPQRPITEVFVELGTALNCDYEAAVKYLRSTYPLSEAITWTTQIEEARAITAWLADNPTLTIGDMPVDVAPFLYDLNASRVALGYPSDLEHLTQRVIENNALFTPALTHATAIRHVSEKALKDAVELNDIEALNAVTWSFPWPPVVIE